MGRGANENNLYECLSNFAKHCSFHILVKFKTCMYVSTVLLLLSVFQVSTLVENNDISMTQGMEVLSSSRTGKVRFSPQDNIESHKHEFCT